MNRSICVLAVLLLATASLIPISQTCVEAASSRNSLAIGPYLQNVTQTSIVVRWNSTLPGTTTVEYGPTASYGTTVTVAGTRTMHEVFLGGLSLNTTYHYRVKSDDAQSTDSTFKTTSPAGDNFEFFGLSDTQLDRTVRTQIFSLMNKYKGEFALHAGDTVNDGNDWNLYVELLQDASPLLNHTVLFPVRGNHDQMGVSKFFDFFTLPQGPVGERFYSFNYGNVHFNSLQVNSSVYYQTGSVENTWLRNDLSQADNNSSIEFKVVYFHYPPYSSGDHGGDLNLQNILCPIFKQYHVDLVLSGHDHDYERSQPPDGITYVVMGGAGGTLRSFPNSNPYSVVKNATHHFVHFTVSGKLINATAIAMDGSIIDNFLIDHRDQTAPVAVPLTAKDTGLGNSIDLDWTGYDEVLEGVKTYHVYMSNTTFTNVSSLSPIADFGTGNFTLTVANLTDYQRYYFVVVAEDIFGNMNEIVSVVSATPTDQVPPLPPGTPVVDLVGNTYIKFHWNASTSKDVMGYHILMNQSEAGKSGPYDIVSTVNDTTLSYNMTGLRNGTTYRFILKAFDDAVPPNNSTPTTEIKATTHIPNRAPWVLSTVTIRMFEDQPIPGTVDLSSIFWDPDGDELTFTAVLADSAMVGNSNVTVSNENVLSAHVAPDWNGAFDVLVTAFDGSLSNSTLVHIIVGAVNDLPLLHLDPEYFVSERTAATIVFSATDIDNDVLMFSHKFPTDLAALSTNILYFNDTTGALYVNATHDMVGTHSIVVAVSDGNATVSGSFLLVVKNTNHPPEIPVVVFPKNGTVYDEGEHIILVAQVSDPDQVYGDKLVVTWYLDSSSTPLGTGPEIQILTSLSVGSHTVRVVVTDHMDLSQDASSSFTVKAKVVPPVPKTKACPNGTIVPVDFTCSTEKTKKVTFFGSGVSVDYIALTTLVLALVAFLIALIILLRGRGNQKTPITPVRNKTMAAKRKTKKDNDEPDEVVAASTKGEEE